MFRRHDEAGATAGSLPEANLGTGNDLANSSAMRHKSRMATDYEIFYRDNPQGLGQPTKEFVTFFDGYDRPNARVLDVGCGQGRDTLFTARLGHSVTGVDQSSTGIRDLLSAARQENLNVAGEVADIRDYDCGGPFDVIVMDRTLHMLGADERLTVLRKWLRTTVSESHLLIADERSNVLAFKAVLDKSKWNWSATLERGGFLFVGRE